MSLLAYCPVSHAAFVCIIIVLWWLFVSLNENIHSISININISCHLELLCRQGYWTQRRRYFVNFGLKDCKTNKLTKFEFDSKDGFLLKERLCLINDSLKSESTLWEMAIRTLDTSKYCDHNCVRVVSVVNYVITQKQCVFQARSRCNAIFVLFHVNKTQ